MRNDSGAEQFFSTHRGSSCQPGNEELTIRETIEAFHRSSPRARIVIVDNNSSDRIPQEQRLIDHRAGSAPTRRCFSRADKAKAFAVQKAFTETDADVFVLCDADLTYPADEIQTLIETGAHGPEPTWWSATVITHSAATERENKRAFHGFGNSLIRGLINTLFGSNLKDILSGYRAFSRRAHVKNYPILSRGFDIEAEMTLLRWTRDSEQSKCRSVTKTGRREASRS